MEGWRERDEGDPGGTQEHEDHPLAAVPWYLAGGNEQSNAQGTRTTVYRADISHGAPRYRLLLTCHATRVASLLCQPVP